MKRALAVDGVLVALDDRGFLREPERWNERVAEALAREEGLEALGPEHWRVVQMLRVYYEQFGLAPIGARIRAETRLSAQRLAELFPRGALRSGWRVAGLPFLGECP